MTRHAVLLRGVNVGKANRVPMAELRELLEGLGFQTVRTLLNSGNAVGAGGRGTSPAIAKRIRAALVERLGVDVPVIVKSDRELAAIVAGQPFTRSITDPSRALVAFTADARSLAALRSIAALAKAPERFAVTDHAAYLWCARGILESEAAKALLGRAGRDATTRNWATTTKLAAMLGEGGEA